MTDSLVKTDGSSGIGNTEFYLQQALAGDEESVRLRLINALETLNYRVLSEHPLQAKRGARGLGAFYASADVLDYPTRLTVALKPLGNGSTLVTLDYEVKDAWNFSTKGDRQTLRREAEAILALAADRSAPTSCRACGAYNPGDSQFCRLCGTQYAAGEPAELEVMRLTAGARAWHQMNMIGMVFGLVGLLFALLLAASGTAAAAKLSFLMLALGEVIALVVMTFGASYLHNTLNPRRREGLPPADARRAVPPPRYDSSPPPVMRGSVTDGTTDLLGARPGRRTPAELRREH